MIGVEVHADKTRSTVMSGDQKAGQRGNTKIGSSSFERLEDFKYLDTVLTNQYSIQEEIKSKLK